MEPVLGKLTVCFESPFWVGVFERTAGGKLTACKVTFGAEPRDQEVYDFVLRYYAALRYSPPVEAAPGPHARNPKRIQREARKLTRPAGVGTKSQQALQLQREEQKAQRKTAAREDREAEKLRRFAQRQQKKKEKHRGR